MTFEIAGQRHTAGLHLVFHSEGPAQLVAHAAHFVAHRDVQAVRLVVGLGQFEHPLGAGSVEDQLLHVVAIVLEFLHGFKCVDHAPQGLVGFSIGQY